MKTRYNLGKRDFALAFKKPSLCQTQFKESTSIDSMIKRAVMGDSSVFRKPQFIDCLAAPESFHDAANKTAFARSVWEDLPESVKQAYGSPEALIAEYDALVASRSVQATEKPVDKTESVTPDKGADSSTESAHANT